MQGAPIKQLSLFDFSRPAPIISDYSSFMLLGVGLAILGGGYVENYCLLRMGSRKFGGGLGVGRIITANYGSAPNIKVNF